MSSSPNRKSPRRREAASSLQNSEYNDLADDSSIDETFHTQQPSDKHTIGKRTGVTLPPRGTIPVNNAGYEDIDAFWDAAKSPNPNSGKKPSSRDIKEAKRRDRRLEKQRMLEEDKQNEQRQLDERARKKPPELLTQPEDDGAFDGIATPKNVGWSNRLLHKAMGIPTDDSPTNTVLSKVSTAPPSAKSLATLDSASARHQTRAKATEVQLERVAKRGERDSPYASEELGDASFDGKGADPPEEMSKGRERGLDPEEEAMDPEEAFDSNDQISTAASNADESSRRSIAAKSSGKTPDMENSMEEMVERYDDEYNDNEDEGPGFELAAQEDVGFDNDHDDLNDDYEEKVSLYLVRWICWFRLVNHSSLCSAVMIEQKVAAQKTTRDQSDDDEDDEERAVRKPNARSKTTKSKTEKQAPITPISVLRTKKSQDKKNQTNRVNWSTPNGTAGIPIGNRGYEAVPVSEYKEQYAPGQEPRSPSGTVLRRSSRARFKPLQFWKNEKLIFEPHNETGMLGEAMGDMPVVAGVQRALPTPHKERVAPAIDKKKEKDSKKKRARKDDQDDDDSHDGGPSAKIPFNPTQLMKKYKFSKGEHGSVWSETLEDTTDLKVVSRLDNRSFSKLPLSSTRGKKESKVVGFASQAFHVPTDPDDLFPGYISGNVVLPPRGIKDAEGVGLCSQVFNVGDCQPNSVEFALADPSSQDGEFDAETAQRFLLSKGDMFQIPPGNVYRIENHSKTDEARLFWTIIKCTSKAEQESDEE
eukprot:CCRYP_011029-RA/>CCRYP_011029-RA protein AED:0.02 eAED:0.02 QI:244/1/1/1/1/1/2/525/757